MLEICFIGLGSIGLRHLHNITEILEAKKEEYAIDALRSSRNELPLQASKKIREFYYNIKGLPDEYDIIFITNPTALHYKTLLNVKDKAKHIFLEKPIFDKPQYDLIPFAEKEGICYIACPLRYMSVMRKLKEIISSEKIFSVDVKCSSYLPDWRPQSDYRNSYSAKKELGGGVDIDLIHEWDYVIDLFGFPKSVKSMKGKYSDLEIDSNDIAIYIAEYEDKLLQIHLDYFGRVPQRRIEIYTRDDVIVANLLTGHISYLKSGRIIEAREEGNECHKREIEAFLEMVLNNGVNKNDIENAVKTLKIATKK